MAKIDLLLALIEAGIIDSDLNNLTDHTFPHACCNISIDALVLAWAKDPAFITKHPDALDILITNPPSKREQAKQPRNDLELV